MAEDKSQTILTGKAFIIGIEDDIHIDMLSTSQTIHFHNRVNERITITRHGGIYQIGN